MYKTEGDAKICDGMCFDQEAVLREIFTLWGAWVSTGDPMGNASEYIFINEISRSISTIALHCRQQMTSYYSEALREADAKTEKDKKEYIRSKYPTAYNVVSSSVGSLVCDKENKLLPLSFYSMINKFCHIEEWKYPCKFNTFFDDKGYPEPLNDGHLLLASDDDKEEELCTGTVDKCLQVKVTKRGQAKGGEVIVPTSGHYEICRISVSDFANAARIFITECEKCQLKEIDENAEQVCPV